MRGRGGSGGRGNLWYCTAVRRGPASGYREYLFNCGSEGSTGTERSENVRLSRPSSLSNGKATIIYQRSTKYIWDLRIRIQ